MIETAPIRIMAQIQPLTAELQKVAFEELGEMPARIPDDLRALKLWIDQQPHLKACTDDQFLIQFLRGCKYSLERAKEKIDNFYAIKKKYSDLFLLTDVDEPKFRKFHDTGSYYLLPRTLNDCGPRIFITQFKYCTKEFSLIDMIRHCAALIETVMLDDPYASIYGVTVMSDFAHATTSHILQMNPCLVKQTMAYYNKALTLRFKAICIINLPTYAEQVFKMALSYMPDNLRERVFLCSKNSDTLSEHIPTKYLPREYGGENGSLDQICSEYHKVWDKYREYFKQNANYGTDESLRLGKPMVFDGDLSIEGSFRRLDVD